MKALIDTSVWVASMIATQASHQAAKELVRKVRRGELDAVVSAHTLAEVYSVLTRLPPKQRLSAQQTWQFIQQNILDVAAVVALTAQEYKTLIEYLADQNLVGGITYDAVIATVATKAQVDEIITTNEKDFSRLSLPITVTSL